MTLLVRSCVDLIARIAKFLNLLTFEDTPNYDKLRRLFKEIGELAGESYDSA